MDIWTCSFIQSKMLTFVAAFTSFEVTFLRRLSKVRVMTVDLKMVKVPLQNIRNWANQKKCLVGKIEKMCLSQSVSKIWDV